MSLSKMLITIVAGLVASFVMCILLGAMVSKMWSWFLVPVGLPSLSVIQMAGLLLIVDVATFRYSYMRKEDSPSIGQEMLSCVLTTAMHALFIFLFSFIFTFFM